jgi:hypothetical protein
VFTAPLRRGLPVPTCSVQLLGVWGVISIRHPREDLHRYLSTNLSTAFRCVKIFRRCRVYSEVISLHRSFEKPLIGPARSCAAIKDSHLPPYCFVCLPQSAQTILTQFKAGLAQKALENLSSTGVEVITGVRVVEVTQKQVRM